MRHLPQYQPVFRKSKVQQINSREAVDLQ